MKKKAMERKRMIEINKYNWGKFYLSVCVGRYRKRRRQRERPRTTQRKTERHSEKEKI